MTYDPLTDPRHQQQSTEQRQAAPERKAVNSAGGGSVQKPSQVHGGVAPGMGRRGKQGKTP